MNKFDAINEYFDAIFVITLEGYEDRQASINASFQGMNFEFWPGTDKRNLDADVMRDPSLYDDAMHRKTKRTHRAMTLAEYACSCSHRRIYEHMVKNNIQTALIFEDDAVVNDQSIGKFSELMASIDNDWDVVLFDYYDAIPSTIKGKLKRALYSIYRRLGISHWQTVPKRLIDIMLMRHYNEYFDRAGRLSGAHAYALNLSTAKKYVEYQTPVILQADRIFYYYQAHEMLKVLASKTPLFLRGEVSKNSTIQIHSR